MYRVIAALLLLILIIPQTTSGQDAIAWEKECASGIYDVTETTAPAVMITCYEEDAAPDPMGDNQLINPRFDIDPTGSTDITGWTNVSTGDVYWRTVKGTLSKNKTTTGWAAKWPSQQYGGGKPGITGYLQQAVSARGRTLSAKITAIQGRASVANYNVYARASGGDWVLVWRPFTIDDMPNLEWVNLDAAIVLGQDYDEYMVELEARWDEGSKSLGVKMGDAWFGSE